jgi:hypothetical protein
MLKFQVDYYFFGALNFFPRSRTNLQGAEIEPPDCLRNDAVNGYEKTASTDCSFLFGQRCA